MLSPWLELPGAADVIGSLGELVGLDLIRLGTTADADEIKDTAVTQPLIVAIGVLAASELGVDGGSAGASVIAGHSIGELTAAAVAGALTPAAAIEFAARRGAEMAAACALAPSGMSAVLGGNAADVLAGIAAAGLTPANRNGAGQIVAAGALDDLAVLAESTPPGARVRPLAVAGAFHTRYLASAEEALSEYAQDVSDLGVSAAIELAPAGTLSGIAKRELPGVELRAVKTPGDLEAARGLIASRPLHGQGEHTPDFQIVVTPAKGIFTRAEGLTEGQHVERGTRLGLIRTNRDEHAIVATTAGVLTEWLRHDGDIVAAGLPVALLSDGSEL